MAGANAPSSAGRDPGRRFTTRFPGARLDAFSLLSTWLLLLPAVYHFDASAGPGSPVRALLSAARRLDTSLMRRWPWLRHGAWMLLMRG